MLFFEGRVVFDCTVFDFRAQLGGGVAFMMCGQVRLLHQWSRRVASFVERQARVPGIDRQSRRLGVSRALAACLLFDGFRAAAITSSAFVASAFMFATVALVILCEAGGTFAGRAIAFKFMDAMVGNFELRGFAAQVLGSFFQEDRAG